MCSRTLKNIKSPKPQNGGFTLVEMALVIIIVGIIIATAAPAYKVYTTNVAAQETKDNVDAVRTKIQEFRKKYGRYPLPASLTAARGAVDYGYESDWDGDSPSDGTPFEGQTSDFVQNPDLDDPAAVPGTASSACANGVCVRLGNRLVDHDADAGAVTAEIRPRVRIGAVPFRILNLEEDQAYDSYGNRLTYAVVERLARGTTYDDMHGSIGLTDLNSASLLDPPNAGHFIVLSHGVNQAGAFTKGGTQVNCAAGTQDLANTTCNMGGNAVFIVDRTNSSEGATQYDDVAATFLSDAPPSWKVSEGDKNDIYADNAGGLGILKKDPQEKVDVAGSVQSSGDLMSDQYCDNSLDTNCFSSSLIAGSSVEGLNTCPSGQFMVGIMNSHVVCHATIDVSCPEGEFMQGIAADGSPTCMDVPDCPSETVVLCGTTYTVPGANYTDPSFTNTVGDAVMTSTCRSAVDAWDHAQSGTCPSAVCLVTATSFGISDADYGSVEVGQECTCGEDISVCHNEYGKSGIGCGCTSM